MRIGICIGAILSILTACPTLASNHALYAQLRAVHRTAYYAKQDQMMMERERLKSERVLRIQYERAAEIEGRKRATQLARAEKEAAKRHPAAAFGELPERREGLPDAQIKAMADHFRAEHGVVKAPHKAKR
jgi:hypothetical protein